MEDWRNVERKMRGEEEEEDEGKDPMAKGLSFPFFPF